MRENEFLPRRRSAPDDTWELHVQSEAFDREGAAYASGPSSEDSDSDHYSSSVSSLQSSPYDVSHLEAHLYYFGIRGPRCLGPKLIFRTSKDIFTAPSGPEQDARRMEHLPVYEHEHDKLGKNNLWDTIRSKIVELLGERDIQLSSVDLARFRWVEDVEEDVDAEEDEEDGEKDDDGKAEDVEDEDFEVPPYGKLVTTPITIWVGVLPGSLTGEVAYHSSKDILALLKEHGITDIEVAYRESVARGSAGPELFAPVLDLDPLKAVIDPVTNALGLPIAGLKTLKSQGTMGFYFKVGDELYAVTARHVLFPEEEGNNEYRYITSQPKKQVVLMGTRAFTNFLESIKGHIGTMNNTADVLEKRVTLHRTRAEGGGPDAEQAARDLDETQGQLIKTREAIAELKKFFVKVKKEWSTTKDRIIGHVVWAPPISVATPPHSYTQDVCVVKLDKKKFSKNFKGNVLDLGPEIEAGKFVSLMYPRVDVPSEFNYPADRLLKLRGILSAEEIGKPNGKDRKGNPVRYVIKRGLTTLTTIGRLSGFESHVRRYFGVGTRNSVEGAVFPYDNDSGPFSRGGDSGSGIVTGDGKFVLILTGGTGPTDSPDITFGTPVHWLWDVIKAAFPGAVLYWDDGN
ncbi:uncharacterized protein LAESUDRAFT_769211 [Laetiporus sulphureus 93-53]|uniref:Uncharacterized protein n=1 Tax=Laetiporus sulphureus 93-53 TaxID=1314785 RepID=A0A165AZR9_9APHY|nr:uncharacterized protein LAESUDRAFT_769211 [Laetiporus sulphureus 93-53]KZS99958.1 hypothetical protein LAESUDRAFT_769211 [Laetiporus sulphureus 93-53]